MTNEDKYLEYLKRVTIDLRQTRRRLEDVEQREREPIAIVGMSCRYPGGVSSPEDLWELVLGGRDEISQFPTDRGWNLASLFDPDPDQPGTTYTREGGFLDEATDFDAAFFGISPREALAMDPQQRLLLEGCWEAVEYANIDPASLRGSDTGVFVGLMYHDYGGRLIGSVPEDMEAYLGLGSAGSVASGRLAYTFGLEGPAVTVDTACSSSLVTLHLACSALRRGECAMALTGGVTVLASPTVFVEFARQRGLAPDGRCKSYADAADGTGWSEGAGMLLLERLSDAQRLGHRVLAVVRGSAVNQDGASNGLTAPNGPSQQRVIRQALASAGLSPGAVDVVEGHGTGTTLGDPIEVQALHSTYGRERPNGSPLWLGSVKSNIGHTQAAAGVAGVIKMVMAMRAGVLPQTLHAAEPSRQVDWSSGTVALLTEQHQWDRDEEPRRAGVSSFGVSGTNAHVILEQAPVGIPGEHTATDGGERLEVFRANTVTFPWVISGRGSDALRAQSQGIATHVGRRSELTVSDMGHALARRPRFANRAVLLGPDKRELLAELTALERGDAKPETLCGIGTDVQVVFLFPGQGSQWVGMALELLDESPVFAERIHACAEALAPFTDWSLLDVLRGVDGAAGLDRVDVVQPVLFAVMVSLAALWRGCGVRPAAVVGHSQGEIAAAHVAGGLSLQDAARVVALRSRVLQRLVGRGGMVSISLGAQASEALLARWGDRVGVAALNGPRSSVVSGDSEVLGELLATCEEEGIRAREIDVSYAAHSPQIDEVRDELLEGLAGIAPRSGHTPLFSTVTGKPIDTSLLDAAYWYRNLREPVQLERVVRALLGERRRSFLEVSPHPVLVGGVQEVVDETCAESSTVSVTGSLRRGHGDAERFVRSLAELFVHGVDVAWEEVIGDRGTQPVSLPTYAFQRSRYWLQAPSAGQGARASGARLTDHPLLSAALTIAEDRKWLFIGRLSLQTNPWLSDHMVMGVVLLPGSALLELALHAGAQLDCEYVHELTMEAPLRLSEQGDTLIQISIAEPDGSGARSLSIHSRAEDPGLDETAFSEESWIRNATGVLGPFESQAGAESATERLEEAWPPTDALELDIEDLYGRLSEHGLDYGPAFQGLKAAWRRGGELFAEVTLPDEQSPQANRFGLHPALLDAVLHAGAMRGPGGGSEGAGQSVALPFSWSGVRLSQTGAVSLRVRLTSSGPDAMSLAIFDEHGSSVASVRSLSMRPISVEQLDRAQADRQRPLLYVDWTALPGVEHAGEEKIALLGTSSIVVAEESDFDAGEPGFDVYGDLSSLTSAIDQGGESPGAVILDCTTVSKAGLPEAMDCEVPDATHALVKHVLELAQAWIAEERYADARLVLLTRGAMFVHSSDAPPDPVSASVWGLIRSAISEHPGRFCLLDLDGETVSKDLLSDALAAGETQLAVRKGRLLAPRLAPVAEIQSGEDDKAEVDLSGTVLITGGTGKLGGFVARHLVTSHRVPSLILVSRRGGEAEGAEELERELVELGARVQVRACDVADRGELAALIEDLPQDLPLRGVVHAAGLIDDGVIESLTSERVDRVLEPKVDAAWHLHELTRELDLSMFVLFSSAAGVLGSPGQGNYAAASVFMDALAASRAAQGLTGVSIAWGLWGEAGGLTADLEESDLTRLARSGVRAISEEEGLRLFDVAAQGRQAQPIALALDASALRAQARTHALPSLLRGLVRIPEGRVMQNRGQQLMRRLRSLSVNERRSVALETVSAEVGSVLGHDSSAVLDPERPFKDLGFDSLMAIELRNRLAAKTGLRLPATLVFDYPNPESLVSHILDQIDDVRLQPTLARPNPVSPNEPIAIVGMSCRYPGGVRSPSQLWELLASGKDGIADFPADRGWDVGGAEIAASAGNPTPYLREGGFLYDATEFDSAFFEIGPREALAMDPQQRLMLEASWEAIESAWIEPRSLRGSKTGVYAGLMYHDYAAMTARLAPAGAEGYAGVGGSASIASGRVAYSFGLEGPAVTIDTACSSSLVAIHLACQALRGGECSLALAGGVTVLSNPAVFAEFARQGGLASDGRCKSFAEAADGAGFSEGVGVLLLERLSDARRSGHKVLAVIKGSAINQDGASNGLTAPNGPSQQRVIRDALANAGLSPTQVDAVEAHGTGTALGDPIEAQALLATYGQDREERDPLWLGSIKSNIGHAQAAAGVAGVIKMVMALEHETLPPTLHVDQPSRKVDWSAGAVSLLNHERPWRRNGQPRRAAVSSFGISGTNAHLILEESPTVMADADTGGSSALPIVPWVISARGESALRARAQSLLSHLETEPESSAIDVGLSLAGCTGFDDRAVVLGAEREELLEGVRALAAARASGRVLSGKRAEKRRGLAILFTGQGAQRVGMGRELYDLSSAFRESFEEICGLFDERLGCSLQEIVFGGSELDPVAEESPLHDTAFAQAGLFALETALYRVIERCGVRPDYVAGHSIGELVAAHVAGVLTLEDACTLVAARGRLMSDLPSDGAMVAVQASESEAQGRLAGLEDRVAIAAVNGPTSIVLSGERESVLELAEAWRQDGRKISRLNVSHAFHSPLMDAMLEPFAEVAGQVSYRLPEIPIVSNLTGGAVSKEICEAGYWVRHARETVRFGACLRWLADHNVGGLLELGPDAVLSAMSRDCLSDVAEDQPLIAVAALRGGRPELQALLGGLGALWVQGTQIDWAGILGESGARRVALPTYAFQRQRYWLEGGLAGGGELASIGQGAAEHPLLGAAVALAGERGWLFTGRLSRGSHSWLADHRVLGAPVLAGAVFLELALHAAAQVGSPAVHELTIETPLALPEHGGLQLQMVVGEPDQNGARSIDIYARPEREQYEARSSEDAWIAHARGLLGPSQQGGAGEERGDSTAGNIPPLMDRPWPPAGSEQVDVDDLYTQLFELGLDYGPAFQTVEAAWRDGEDLFVECSLSDAQRAEADLFGLHPALLDGAMHAMAFGQDGAQGTTPLRLPFSWSGVELYRTGASTVRVSLTRRGAEELSLTISDESGGLVALVRSLNTREASPEQFVDRRSPRAEGLYRVEWAEPEAARGTDSLTTPLAVLGEPEGGPTPWAVLGESEGALARRLRDVRPTVRVFRDLTSLKESVNGGESLPQVVLVDGSRGRLRQDPARQKSGGLDVESRSDSEVSDEAPVADLARRACHELMELLQGWLLEESFSGSCLVLLTAGELARAPRDIEALVDAPVWGLAGAAQAEHPGRLLLIDIEDESYDWQTLPEAIEIGLRSEEPQLTLCKGKVLVPRLSRSPNSDGDFESPFQDGTTLITGGTGGLGALVAKHLAVEHGARQLLLVSRRGIEAPGAAELEAELEGLGTQVRIASCDVTQRAQLQELLQTIAGEHPLSAVIHTAGALDDGVLSSLTPERIDPVLAPKIDASWNLHELTRHLDLRAFVLFSSISGVLGTAGQGSYAAANRFLDGLAAYRRKLGLAGVSIAWGAWSPSIGMSSKLQDAQQERLARGGIDPLSTQQGLDLLDRALAADDSLVVATRFNALALREQAAKDSLPAQLRGLTRLPSRRAAVRGTGSLVARLSGASDDERAKMASDFVCEQAAEVLGHSSAAAVEPQRAFKELGFDSLAAIELRNRLEAASDLRLAATVVFDYPSPRALAEHLLARLAGQERSMPSRTSRQLRVEEPIAIVGMACRYPGGVSSPDELWELVRSGADVISRFPTDRGWDLRTLYDPDPDRRGASYTQEGGFVRDALEFDAGFFDISPREALAMDPQQRLLLENCWEALEHAGIDPLSLRGTQTGVFGGVMYADYGARLLGMAPTELEGYIGTGSAGSVACGRVAYALGLEGPAVTIDTACSSSLVALHLACGSLRGGECALALAGGVTILSTPGVFVEFSRQRGLAPDGRCKSFAEAADGTSWAEGIGMLALERLSDAQRLGHRVLALVRGSAVNQDGASNGLTAPNGPSQQRVIRQALANAGLRPAEVDAVEGHGTGTRLGDPIEVQALQAVFAEDRSTERPLWLGSIKSNIGHAQAAAGVAGVIKMTMAMRNGALPRTLHVKEPSKHIDWSAGPVSLLNEELPWQRNGEPLRAGVSSFGISGTNAHVVLEQAPVEMADAYRTRAGGPEGQLVGSNVDRHSHGALPWALSARDEPALRAQAHKLLSHIERFPELELVDIGLSLAGRAQLQQRAVVLGADRDELFDGLSRLAQGQESPQLIQGRAAASGRLALLFTGQGSQRVRMGAELSRRFPAFGSAFEEACGYFEQHLDRSLRDLVLGDGPAGLTAGSALSEDRRLETERSGADEPSPLDDTTFAQAGLFALEFALYRLVRAWGIRPDYLAGHSIGELVAACASGVLSLEDACKVVAARGRLMGALPAGGAMLAVQASAEEARASLEPYEGRVALAAVNSPSSIVLSGDKQAVLELQQAWEGHGRKVSCLRVSHAFHSQHMDPMLEEFGEIVEAVSLGVPTIPILSNVTGDILSAEEARSVGYWVRHVRETVCFADEVESLYEQGARCFLELGPDGVLSAMTRECLAGHGQAGQEEDPPLVAALMRDRRSETHTVLGAVAQAWTCGAELDWRAVFDGLGAKRVDLPTYAFQRERYWLQTGSGATDMASVGQASPEHPLLGASVELADGGWVFTGRLSLQTHSWIADHTVSGMVVLPGTAFLELALRACSELGLELVSELTLHAPLILAEEEAIQIQVSVGALEESGQRALTIHARSSRPEEDDPLSAHEWVSHASGTLSALPGVDASGSAESSHAAQLALLSGAWPPPGAEPIELEDLYDRLAGIGLEYGPVFQGLVAAWRYDGNLLAELSLPQGTEPGSFVVHPALLDTAFHAMLGEDSTGDDTPRIPFFFGGAHMRATDARSLRISLSASTPQSVSLVLAEEAGTLLGWIDSVAARPLPREQLFHGYAPARNRLFGLQWVELAQDPTAPALRRWAMLADDGRRHEESVPALSNVEVVYSDVDSLIQAVDRGETMPEVVLVDVRTVADAYSDDKSVGEPLASESLLASAHAAVSESLRLLQRWLAHERLVNTLLVFVTHGSVAIEEAIAAGLPGAPIWGLIRSAQAEHPGRFALVDMDGARSSWQALARALAGGESQLALRNGTVLVPRLTSLGDTTSEDSNVLLDRERTVLITGGTGGLGAVLARHLVRSYGVQHLLLTSRRGSSAPGALELERELTALGAQVTIEACDVSDRRQLQALIGAIDSAHSLGTIVHCAGAVDNGLLATLSPERMSSVLAPKLDAAWHLHELTAHLELQAYVLFSSIASLFGGPGQANYAAANAFLDDLAEVRRSRGLSATSIVWGLWGETGMGSHMGEVDLRRAVGSSSLSMLSTEEGLELFDLALRRSEGIVFPARLNSRVLREEARAGTLPVLLRSLVRVPSAARSERTRQLKEILSEAPTDERESVVLEVVRTEVASVLGHASATAIDPTVAFREMGFDSLAAVELRNRLNALSDVNLAPTVVFDYPTARELAGYLLEQCEQGGGIERDGLDARLDQLEMLLTQTSDDGEREHFAMRLKACLSVLDGGSETSTDNEIDTASDDELFELIDRGLGTL
jgi:acyl transferase domain-containing protein/NAD(P)-dependent dehydrogenase (short-subunit alcohol dehydrogenase family)/acyl carrier protein